jgi:5-methylcytosine-specific restriction enzyme subunit McrC
MDDLAESIVLVEHQDSKTPVQLDVEERDALQRLVPELTLRPVQGEAELYVANPRGMVGAVQLGDRRFELRPKIEIRRLAFILAYSMDPKHWQESGFDYEEADNLFEAVVPGFAYQVEEALRRGLLQGYRPAEDSLQTVRGRIRFDDQLRSRYGLMPPIECRFEEFTEDIEINRLLKAAIERLRRIRLRSQTVRRRLRALRAAFANVTSVGYDPRNVPEVLYTRLNLQFRSATEFARLILRSRSLSSVLAESAEPHSSSGWMKCSRTSSYAPYGRN